MNQLYKSIGVSKQAFHKYLNRKLIWREERGYLLQIIHQLREDHPTMGCRDMYYKLQPLGIGRDAFEAFCKQENLQSKRIKNRRSTTDSSGVIRFENLLENRTLTGINQAWVSDITYFEVNAKFYYLTFILDAFSRRIIGYSTSDRLLTKSTTLPALEKAIETRKDTIPEGLIFHSDGGGQYYAKSFLSLTNKHKIKNSMCEYAWENGKAERINGVIKNNYLKHRNINNLRELKQEVDRSVKLYNEEKPHIELQRKSPIMFEKLYLRNNEKPDDDTVSDGIIESQTRSVKTSPASLNEKPSKSTYRSRIIKSNKCVKVVNVI